MVRELLTVFFSVELINKLNVDDKQVKMVKFLAFLKRSPLAVVYFFFSLVIYCCTFFVTVY